jgi:hypothetical protein
MSTTSKRAPIDPKSKEELENLMTTEDSYRELDAYIRLLKEEEAARKRRLTREVVEVGDEMVAEIEEKHIKREQERIEMMEKIFEISKEEFLTVKEMKEMPYEDIKKTYGDVLEWKKPWWRKLINVFR